jgi:hypothetical protein
METHVVDDNVPGPETDRVPLKRWEGKRCQLECGALIDGRVGPEGVPF